MKSELSDHRNPPRLDLTEISQQLSDLGYTVQEINQPWRHVYAIVTKDKSSWFAKIAASPAVSPFTENEATWNQVMGKRLTDTVNPPFSIATIQETGRLKGDLFYFVGTFFPSRHLPDPPVSTEDSSQLMEWVEKIADCNLFLLRQEGVLLPRDSVIPPSEKLNKIVESAEGWSENIRSKIGEVSGLERLLDYVQELPSCWKPGLCHGDVTLGHFLQEPGRFALIDGEHASGSQGRFYDVAYFFNRLYVRTGRPDAAMHYLRVFRKQLTEEEERIFVEQFPVLLALRTVAGWNDYTLNHPAGNNFFLYLNQKLTQLLVQGILAS